jgi:hypothetical protein
MRINLIGNFTPNTGLSQDALILRGLLTHVFGKDVVLCKVPHVHPQCPDANVNIFLEVINPALFSYAKKNIWIPNVEWTYRNWKPYMGMVDEIWAKTKEAYDLFSSLTNTKVLRTGWTSIDKGRPDKKNYSKAIVLVGKNIYRNPKQLIRAYHHIYQNDPDWYGKLPTLYIPYNPAHVGFFVPAEVLDKVVQLTRELKDSEYTELLHECGLAICTSAAEGFGHAVNEAMSAECNLLLSQIRPFTEDLVSDTSFVQWAATQSTHDHPDCFGMLVDVNMMSIVNELKDYVSAGFRARKELGTRIRMMYEDRHDAFVARMESILKTSIVEEELTSALPKEEDLPDVSIITLTRNRRNFMPLAKYSYMIQSYPEDKLEWVIVDDGDDPIEDTLIGVPNVKYVKCEPGLSIGEKRNLGVQNAMYDILCMMDDDDVYPNNSVLQRVAFLLKEPAKQCGFCTIIPCYEITKYSSFVNVPPYTLPMSQRVSEATLVFTRDFWKERPFIPIQIAEGDTFIHGREHMCREMSPQEIIVSLVHPKNTSSRKLPEIKEPNGCHYGFNEQLFALVSQIGEELNTSCQKESASSGDAPPS